MRVVAALGGNALLARGEPPDIERQRAHVAEAARALAALAAAHELVITHGNGPQVGLLALQAEAYSGVRPYPLDVLGAESEGMIGYLIEEELAGLLPDREVAALLTLVEMDPADPAFQAPSKPIGPVYTEAEARRLQAERGFPIARAGVHYRRVVPSPEPLRIREARTLRRLSDAGVIIVCAGGGGVPVRRTASGGLMGVEAVVDKDLAAALLSRELGAAARPIRRTTPAALRGQRFAAGSMGPKVEAACRFVEQTGGVAGIGALADAAAILRGEAGTWIGA
jgi:carbamate kinase